MKACSICKQKFKREWDLEQHIDKHTPYWKGKKIVLSGADHIRLFLVSVQGWRKSKNESLKRKNFWDASKFEKLQKFRLKHRIEFDVKGTEVRGFRPLKGEENIAQ